MSVKTTQSPPIPTLVQERAWQPLFDQRVQTFGLTALQSRLGQSIITTLHSRSAGISIALALSLARALTQDSVMEYDVTWTAVLNKMRRSLDHLANRHDTQRGHYQLRFRSAPSFVVLKIVQPLIQAATRTLGENILFCADNARGWSMRRTKARYPDYEQDLKASVLALLNDQESALLPSLFWQEQSILLTNITRQRSTKTAIPNTALNRAPHIHPINMHIFLHLNASNTRSHDKHRKIQMAQKIRLNERRLQNPGVDGIRTTTRLDDLNRMLTTEYLYPDILRLDRLLNEGFWILKRPPKPIKLRDALIIGVCPPESFVQLSRPFIQTCWFDFVRFISVLLRYNGLDRSEFRWIEGDAFRRARAQTFRMNNMEQLPRATFEGDSPAHRQQFLNSMNWLPSFLDESVSYQSLDLLKDIEHTSIGASGILLNTWLQKVWKLQTDSPDWGEREGGKLRRVPIEQYGYVHVMVFLPSELKSSSAVVATDESETGTETGQTSILSLQSVSRRLQFPLHHLSITWTPNHANDYDQWNFDGRVHMKSLRSAFASNQPINQVDPLIAPETIAAELLRVWVENVLKELGNA